METKELENHIKNSLDPIPSPNDKLSLNSIEEANLINQMED